MANLKAEGMWETALCRAAISAQERMDAVGQLRQRQRQRALLHRRNQFVDHHLCDLRVALARRRAAALRLCDLGRD